MKITSIQVENFLGFEIFKVDEFGKFNRITGGIRVGKSAILKAVKEAFKSSGVDPDLIRVGADEAKILIGLDNGSKIDRRLKPGSNNVKVTKADSEPMNSPQKWLNQIFGPNSFNPVDFFSKPKERRGLILSAVPIKLDEDELFEELTTISDKKKAQGLVAGRDFDQHGLELLAEIRQAAYDMRHEVGISVTRMKKAIEQDKKDLPAASETERWKDFDQTKRTEDLVAAENTITKHENDADTLERLRLASIRLAGEIEACQQTIKDLTEERELTIAEGKELANKVESFEAPDVDTIRSELAEYREFQKVAQMLELMAKREAELEEIESEQAALDKVHKYLANDLPKRLLQQVKLSDFDELEIDGDKIFVKGVAIDKLSTSEQLVFSVRLARHLAGELKVICVDRFESLDENGREAFLKEAAGDEFEYFITQVTDGPLKVEAETPE